MAVAVEFEDLVRRAGAVMVSRAGRSVPAHYGSAPGELAVCVRRVGLALRAELASACLEDRSALLEPFITRRLGHPLAEGGVAHDGRLWWCRGADGRRLTLVFPHEEAARLRSLVGRELSRFGSMQLRDTSERTVIIGLVGHDAHALLASLCPERLSPDRRTIPPFFEMELGETRFDVLAAPSTGALFLVDSSGAAELWRALERAGKPFGISCVGIDSITRYELLRRERDV